MLEKILKLFDLTAMPRLMWRNRSLLWQLTKRNTLARYRGSFLGLLWSFIFPLIMLGVYTFVFSWLMGAKWGVEGSDWGLDVANSRTAFAMIMLCGLTVYNLFTEGVSACAAVVPANPNYVKKVIFPLEILPVAQILSTFMLGFAWVFILLAGVVFLFGKLSFTMLLLPVVWLPLFLVTLGVSFFVASLGVYLRDTPYLVTVATQLMFWTIPIVYPIKMLHDRAAKCEIWVGQMVHLLVDRNPFTVLVEQTRRVFLFGLMPEWQALATVLLVGVVVFQLGWFFFIRTKRGFADVL